QAPQPDRGLVHVGEDRGARFRTRVHPPPYQAQPGLAPSAEIGAAVEAETRLLRLVLADLVVAREYVAQFIADPGVGSDEPAAPRLDGLHELGREERLPADLDLGEPLAAQPVEPGPAVLREQVEGVFSLEVRRETQAEAEVVRPPLLLARLDDHDPPARLLPDLIVHALEIAAAVDAAQIGADLLLAQRLAGLGLEQRAQHFGAGPPQTLEADFVHHAHRLELGDLPAAQRFVLCRRQAVAAERLRQRARGVLTHAHRIAGAVEAAGRDVAQLGCDQHVARAERRKLPLHVGLAQKIDQLRADRQRGADLIALERRRGDVDGNDNVAAEL